MFDLIYIDGEHHAASALEDAILAFPLLKVRCAPTRGVCALAPAVTCCAGSFLLNRTGRSGAPWFSTTTSVATLPPAPFQG